MPPFEQARTWKRQRERHWRDWQFRLLSPEDQATHIADIEGRLTISELDTLPSDVNKHVFLDYSRSDKFSVLVASKISRAITAAHPDAIITYRSYP